MGTRESRRVGAAHGACVDAPRTRPISLYGTRPGEPGGSLLPLHFGPADRRLFGCLHLPRATPRDRGVVLCHPFGHEAIQFHRALGQLAQLLAGAGFAVLRFDAFGCGDSAGRSDELRLAGWLDDIARAVDELRARQPAVQGIDLAGLRLGGTLAAVAAARRGDVGRLVLWDPVPSGREHLAELVDRHRQLVRKAHVLPTAGDRSLGERQLLGFTLAQELLDELRALDPSAITRRPAERVLLALSHPDADPSALRERLTALGSPCDEQRQPMPELWGIEEDFGKQLVPFALLLEIVKWMG
jgi:uncharacterized protein